MYLREEMRNRDQCHKEMTRLTALRKRMEDCRFYEILYGKVTDFLHYAISALRVLAAVTQEVISSWEMLSDHCQELPGDLDSMKRKVKILTDVKDSEERQSFLTSAGFKHKVSTRYVKLFALHSMFDEYAREISLIQVELSSCMP